MVTDRALAAPREVLDVIEAALAAGAPAVQLRDKTADAATLFEAARALRELTHRWSALLFVNDRVDVALAVQADGAHLGPDDLPVAAVRARVPSGFLLGYSTDDPAEARRAADAGADYIGCGAVYATGTKTDAGAPIGLMRLDEVARSVSIPVVAIGGITPERASEVARTRAAGIAVVGAVMSYADPGAVVRSLLAPFAARRPEPATD